MLRAGLLGAAVIALDVLAFILGIWLAANFWLWWRPQLALVVPIRVLSLYGPNPFMPPAALMLLGWLIAMRSAGLYNPGQMTSSVHIAKGITRAAFLVAAGVVVLQFFTSAQSWSRVLILATVCSVTALSALLRLSFFRIQRFVPKPFAPVRVAIAGTGEDAARMDARIRRYGHGTYEVVGFLKAGGERAPAAIPEARVLGEVVDFPRLVNTYDLRVVIITAFALDRDEALSLATRADQMGLKVFQVPFTWGAANPRIDLATLGDLRLIDLTALAYPSWGGLIKRVMDLVLTLAGGLVLLPFLLLVALAVKLQDGGPVLFVQPRAGRGGRQFPFFKFRSMVTDAEQRRAELAAQNEAGGVLFKMSHDPRVTPLGSFLRRWSIDELPQLWNVIRGDMNLVGPRPLPMSDLEGAEKDPEIAYWLELRGKVKPGITGAWQTAGRSDLSFYDMVQLDIDYVQSWSLILDIVILLRTLPAVLRGRGAR